MDSPILFFLVFSLFTITTKNAIFIEAQVDKFGLEEVVSEDFELPMSMSSLYEDDEMQFDGNGRSLLWHRMVKYYISYGALSANRIPCPPRSGRSYYTHHCYHATGPAHPYTRGCSAITRCRRWKNQFNYVCSSLNSTFICVRNLGASWPCVIWARSRLMFGVLRWDYYCYVFFLAKISFNVSRIVSLCVLRAPIFNLIFLFLFIRFILSDDDFYFCYDS